MIQEFARVLREKIRIDLNNYADDMANGVCTNFEQYKKLCGVIEGLGRAEGHLLDLLKNIEDAEK